MSDKPQRPTRGRKPSQPRLIKSLQQISGRDALSDEIIFQHSILCQVCLPRRDPKEARTWETKNGDTTLLVQAGYLSSDTGKSIPVGLPYGVTARLLFMGFVSEIVRNKADYLKTGNRIINLEKNMTAFVKRLGLPVTSHYIKNVKNQILRLTRSQWSFFMPIAPNRLVIKDIKLFEGLELWYPDHPEQGILWATKAIPTREFVDFCINHAVPMDERAIRNLTDSALALDLYYWLTQRLCRIEDRQGEFVSWHALYKVYGESYANKNDFYKEFRKALQKVKAVYPACATRVSEGACTFQKGRVEGNTLKGFWLEYTPPPISHASDYKPLNFERRTTTLRLKNVEVSRTKKGAKTIKATKTVPISEAEFLAMPPADREAAITGETIKKAPFRGIKMAEKLLQLSNGIIPKFTEKEIAKLTPNELKLLHRLIIS
jgi:hypothetical protein